MNQSRLLLAFAMVAAGLLLGQGQSPTTTTPEVASPRDFEEPAAGEGEIVKAPLDDGEFVVFCPIEGMVDDGMLVVVRRAIGEAIGARAIIFQVDTPGGRVDSAVEISKAIVGAPCQTIAFVKGQGAISAGALISYSCDEIIMTGTTSIGASAPVIMGGGDPDETMDAKAKSYLRSRYRALGKANGHDPLLGEAMVDPSMELRGYFDPEKERFIVFRTDAGRDGAGQEESGESELLRDVIRELIRDRSPNDSIKREVERRVSEALDQMEADDAMPEQDDLPPETDAPVLLEDGTELICEAGELLTLDAEEARRYGLIDLTAADEKEVMAYYGFPELPTQQITPTWSEELYRWLTSPLIAAILLLLGIGGIYVEIRTPGIGLPGLIGAIALVIFFGSHLVIGLADWLDIVLVVLGVSLIALEVFVIPGFGIVGISGIVCLVAGVYLSLTRVPIPQYSWDFARLEDAGQTVCIASILFFIFAVLTWRIMPHMPFARRLILSDAQQVDTGWVVQTEDHEQSVGLRGVSTTMLRPAGRGRFGARTYDVVTRGEYLGKGQAIEIIEVAGNRFVVAAAEPGEQA